MLGIFIIICLTVFMFIKLKEYSLLKVDYTEPIKIDNNDRTYNVCYHAVILNAVSIMVILLGYIGCVWPYLFIEEIGRKAYLTGVFFLGIYPVLFIAYACYLTIRSAQGYIKISKEEIEYKRYKSFSVKLSDIKKITSPSMYLYHIHLKEKGKKPLYVNLNGFYKKKELCSLIKQLSDYTAKIAGRDKSLANKICFWRGWMILGKFLFAICSIVVLLLLLYVSYCCIDYDFFRKDYTALYNGLYADPNKPENAWPHYIQAAVNYVELEEDLQDFIRNNIESNQLDFNDNQVENLKIWFDKNTSSWTSLKKATSIDYCNATYKNISLINHTNREDFSHPSDTGYGKIRNLYSNANACCLAGILDLDWLYLFEMQLTSSKHFTNGKSFIDQLVGYSMLARSVKFLTEQNSYDLEDLQKVRNILKEHFPEGLSSLSIEGEILITCSIYDNMINYKKIPVQTPLNPMFLIYGSISGTEAYARKHYAAILEQVHKGIEIESKDFSITNFPIMRNMLLGLLDGSIAKIYKLSQRTGTNLSAAYFILDLEEYKLIKGYYPEDVSQLKKAGLTSQLPDDPDTDGKITYLNNGERAILYAVGPNGKDDGGYKDNKGSDKKRDDIIYWQRNLK